MTDNDNSDLTHVEFAVLGLVCQAENGIHAYLINERIEERGMRNWTNIGKSSVYRVLKKLEKRKIVESCREEQDGRLIRIYKITDFGKKILKNQVYETLYNFKGRRDPDFDLAYAYMWILNDKEKKQAFQHSLDILKSDKNALEKIYDENKNREIYITGLFKRPIMLITTHEEFIKWVLEEIDKKNK
jgi:DNA-binding PadR family transcriptional regulator